MPRCCRFNHSDCNIGNLLLYRLYAIISETTFHSPIGNDAFRTAVTINFLLFRERPGIQYFKSNSDLVHHVSIIFQEVYLFQDTMMNNIRMGNQTATDEQVIEAAKKAHCHEFIEKLPQGYQTVISEGGASLSGGESQRVAIARAILKDSPIILLDEALSSLDAENAVAIQKGIEEMIKGKTVFLVSHTLSYIQNADQILVLSDGILQGCGKHNELLQTVPLYQTMWEKEKSIKNWKLA